MGAQPPPAPPARKPSPPKPPPLGGYVLHNAFCSAAPDTILSEGPHSAVPLGRHTGTSPRTELDPVGDGSGRPGLSTKQTTCCMNNGSVAIAGSPALCICGVLPFASVELRRNGTKRGRRDDKCEGRTTSSNMVSVEVRSPPVLMSPSCAVQAPYRRSCSMPPGGTSTTIGRSSSTPRPMRFGIW